MSSEGGGLQLSVFNDGARFNPASNAWYALSMSGAPLPRANHTAIWTGTEMIVWGGQSGAGLNTWLNDGARYNPATDTWKPLSSANTPAGRSRHTAVWTSTEMIVWGGFTGGGPYQETGGRYDPETDTWRTSNYASAPAGRIRHTAVWTGHEMLIWGGEATGSSFSNEGGSYDPVSDIWTPLTTTPRAPAGRQNHAAVWTGSEMLIFGGSSSGAWDDDAWSCALPKLLYLYSRP
jgi:N-acetylneuraminic acid mutarotase